MTSIAARQTRGFAREAADITALSRGLVAYNIAYLMLAWVVAIGSIALFWAHPRWYTFILAFLIVSSRQQALLNCEHEAVHRKFLPGRRLNEFVGTFLCAAAVGSPFGAAQARHLAHHRLLGSAEDPDHDLHEGPDKRTRAGLVRHFLGGLLGGYAGMVLMGPPPKGAGKAGNPRRDLISLVIVQAVLAVGLTLVFAWWVYPALWLAPLATVTAFCHLMRSFVEHAVTDGERAEHSNRLITIRSNLVERFLLSPYNMNLHAEHHIVPSVPAPRLPELQNRVAARDDCPPVLERSSYSSAIRGYFRALAS